MRESSLTAIRGAIDSRRRVAFEYGSTRRVVEPHICGVDAQGVLMLTAWQVGGETQSASASMWRTFRIADMRALTVLDPFPGVRSGYNPNDARFVEIIARLES